MIQFMPNWWLMMFMMNIILFLMNYMKLYFNKKMNLKY